jgi:biofilm PGA synthesis N-glycosyltransferase PgaC
MDVAFTLGFIPGVVLALMGYYWIAGWLTLLVMPLAMLLNFVMFRIQNKMFKDQGLKVRSNLSGFIFYSLFYSFILQPASVYGYAKELFNGTIKNWGTK